MGHEDIRETPNTYLLSRDRVRTDEAVRQAIAALEGASSTVSRLRGSVLRSSRSSSALSVHPAAATFWRTWSGSAALTIAEDTPGSARERSASSYSVCLSPRRTAAYEGKRADGRSDPLDQEGHVRSGHAGCDRPIWDPCWVVTVTADCRSREQTESGEPTPSQLEVRR